MAQKEATVYIVDVAESMGQKRHGREVNDLDWALLYVWDKIAATVATERKTANVAVIGLRTDGSQNELDGEEAYHHISVLKGLGQPKMPDIRDLKEQLKPSNTDAGDAISAVVVAIQMISSFCRTLKYDRKIILITNGNGSMDAEGLEGIIGKCKQDNIELIILGVDFDDPEYGYKEEEKDSNKVKNEKTLKELAAECSGLYGTLAQAIEEMAIPRMRVVRPVHSFKGCLTLGNPEEYDSAMSIDVERYPRVMVQRPPSASQFVVRSNMAPGETQSQFPAEDGQPNPDSLAAVKNVRTYQVLDEDAPGGKREVEQEDLAKGYNYGSTAVPIMDSDRNVTDFESKAGLDIIGFVAKEQYERYLDMSKTNVIIAERTNEKAIMALSSFIHALFELDTYVVARLVAKDNKHPLIVLLAPSIEADVECLYEVELPFAEDVRSYRFPALDKIVTVSGKELKQHRYLPSDALMDAMSDYVDSMDLSKFGTDDEGQPAEYMPIEETFSPALHRINHVVRHRAVHPDSKIPPIQDILIKYSKPPEELVQDAQSSLDAMIAAADVKKVPPKAQSRKQRRDVPKPLSGLDVTALLSAKGRGARISPENAIPEFKQILDKGDIDDVRTAYDQLAKIVRDYIRHSVGDSGYGRSIEAIRVMREEAVDIEVPEQYNEFMKKLKAEILQDELGGDRKDMWWQIRVNRMGLIQKKECGGSNVGEDEAKGFLLAK